MSDPADPRLAVIPRRLASVARVLAVTGGKGGIGKSMVATLAALALARAGKRAGLLDLDLTSPTDHVVLGARRVFPTEEFGLEPPVVAGVRFMSVQFFTGDRAAPMRGREISDALIELLAVTSWGDLDVLVVDMPPGLSDAMLDAIRLLPSARYLVVANESAVVLETVRRTLRLLGELAVPVEGIVENMARGEGPAVADLSRSFSVPWLGRIPFDPDLEAALGDPERIARTEAARAIERVAARLGASGAPGDPAGR